MCSVHFFGLHYRLGEDLYDIIDLCYFGMAFSFLAIFFVENKETLIPKKNFLFSNAIIIFFIFLLISTFSGYYYHDQFPLLTLLAMRYFLYFLIFYILLLQGVQAEYLLRIVIIFATIYMIVFTLQLYLFPNAIVPLGHVDDFDRGFLRIRLEGVGFVTLSAFYSLNKFLENKKNKWHLAFYLLCFIFIYILGFRTLLATFLLSSLILVLVYNRKSLVKSFLSLTLGSVFVVIFMQFDSAREVIQEMMEMTNAQVELGEEYIRVLTFNFLFSEVNVNFGSLLFGNGRPFEGTSYGNLVLGIGAKEDGYISADLGLIGFLFNYGLLSLIAFLNIFRIAIFKQLPQHSIYLNVFFLYLVISSFTTSEIYRAGMFGVEMIGLYLITYVSYVTELEKEDGIENC